MISKRVCTPVCASMYTSVLCVLICVYTCIHFPAVSCIYFQEVKTSQEREAHLRHYTVVSNAASHEKEPELLWELTGKWLGQGREDKAKARISCCARKLITHSKNDGVCHKDTGTTWLYTGQTWYNLSTKIISVMKSLIKIRFCGTQNDGRQKDVHHPYP